ncbi:protease [bacterium]|nr:protease [bacterium]MBU1754114.1 protease [bacterium]
MNFELNHGLIWITFELIYEGNSVVIDKCILDTGSAATAIDIDLVNFNYYKSATIKRLFGIGGGKEPLFHTT